MISCWLHDCLLPFKQIASLDQRTHVPVRDAAGQHPEAAIGMHVLDAFDAEFVGGPFDAARYGRRRFHFVVLDVNRGTEAGGGPKRDRFALFVSEPVQPVPLSRPDAGTATLDVPVVTIARPSCRTHVRPIAEVPNDCDRKENIEGLSYSSTK